MDPSKSSLFRRSSSNGAFRLHQAPLLGGLFGTREFNPVLNLEANQGDSMSQQGFRLGVAARPQGLFDSVDVVPNESSKTPPQKDLRKKPSHDPDIFFLENFVFPTPARVAQDMFRREEVALPKVKPQEKTKPKAQAKPKSSKLALPKTGVNKKTVVRLKQKRSTQETEVKGDLEEMSIDEEISKPHLPQMESRETVHGDPDEPESSQGDPDQAETSHEEILAMLSRISARLNPQPGCSCYKDHLEQPKQAGRRSQGPQKKVKKDSPRQYVTLTEEDSSDDQFSEPEPEREKIFKCTKKPRAMPNRKRMAMKEKYFSKGPAVPKKKRAAARKAKAASRRSMHAVSAPQGGIPWLPLPEWLWPKDEPDQDKQNQD